MLTLTVRLDIPQLDRIGDIMASIQDLLDQIAGNAHVLVDEVLPALVTEADEIATLLAAGSAATPEQITQAHSLLVDHGKALRALRDQIGGLVTLPPVTEPEPVPEDPEEGEGE